MGAHATHQRNVRDDGRVCEAETSLRVRKGEAEASESTHSIR